MEKKHLLKTFALQIQYSKVSDIRIYPIDPILVFF